MTMARIIMGEVFLAILVLAVIYAAVSPTVQPIVLPQFQMPWFAGQGDTVTELYSLFKGTNVSQSVMFVNLNITMKAGIIYVVFSDQSNTAFEAAFQHTTDKPELEASYTQHGEELQVTAYGEAGRLNLTLGNSYQYDGNVSLRVGGLVMTLGRNANVGIFAVHVEYAGGVSLTIGTGASFEQLVLDMDVGGLQLNVDADSLERSAVINTRMNIGGLSTGVNVDTSSVGVSLDATVDMGGITVNHPDFSGPVSSTHCTVKTAGYSSATNKLDVYANVGLGGVTLQQNIQLVPGFQA